MKLSHRQMWNLPAFMETLGFTSQAEPAGGKSFRVRYVSR